MAYLTRTAVAILVALFLTGCSGDPERATVAETATVTVEAD